jgi:hypothetical protein
MLIAESDPKRVSLVLTKITPNISVRKAYTDMMFIYLE